MIVKCCWAVIVSSAPTFGDVPEPARPLLLLSSREAGVPRPIRRPCPGASSKITHNKSPIPILRALTCP